MTVNKRIVMRKNEFGKFEKYVVPANFFNKEDNLIYKSKPDETGHSSVVRLPKGSWDIMDALVGKILNYLPGPIVEIGMGESSTIFAQHAIKYGIKLYSCDIMMGGMFKVFNKPLFDNHICFLGRSEEFIKDFKDEPSIVFLDGEHNYESVKQELDFFLPLLKKDGVMFLHDTFPPHEHHLVKDKQGCKPGTVYRARQDLEKNADVDVLTFPYSAHGMGLTIVMKHDRNQNRPYWKKNGRIYETVEP